MVFLFCFTLDWNAETFFVFKFTIVKNDCYLGFRSHNKQLKLTNNYPKRWLYKLYIILYKSNIWRMSSTCTSLNIILVVHCVISNIKNKKFQVTLKGFCVSLKQIYSCQYSSLLCMFKKICFESENLFNKMFIIFMWYFFDFI